MYLGVRAVLAKSFARIHRANLINWGVVPLTCEDPSAYDALERDDRLRLDGLRAALASGDRLSVLDTRLGRRFSASCVLTTRERDILLAGGLLAQTSRTRAPEAGDPRSARSEEHTSELQSLAYLVCRLLLEKKKKRQHATTHDNR